MGGPPRQQAEVLRLENRLQAGPHVQACIDAPQVAIDRATRQAEDPADLPGEVVFAPKELKVAQDLSERLGYATVSGRTRSRPAGLSSGRRSLSESDHRRALMLPQELIQMPSDRLLVLKAGALPIRGRKIVYWRERAFRARLQSPPAVVPRPLAITASAPAGGPRPGPQDDPLTLDVVQATLATADLEPLPPQGAAEAEVEDWVDRFLATTVTRDLETPDVR